MSDPDETPPGATPQQPPDELVLAAIERAARHDPRASGAVPVWAIVEQLALPRRSGAARRLGARLETMQGAGWLEGSRRHGVRTWQLTDAGARRLRSARGSGGLPPLPESPQHRAWSRARTAARQEIERFRADVRARVEEAGALLEARPPARSDAWLELAEALQRACRRVGSASYCLYEWAEPPEDRPDVDERLDPADAALEPDERARRRARRTGRRNVRLWDDRHGA